MTSLMFGDRLILNASITFNYPLNSVTWMHEGIPVTANDNITITTPGSSVTSPTFTTLVLNSVTINDAGVYAVIVDNDAGFNSESFDVTILGKWPLSL